MTLKEDIEKFKEQFIKNVPAETQRVMQEEADRLERSGVTNKCLTKGGKAPSFALTNQENKLISSAELLAKGPLVVSFYRGGW